MNTLPRTPMGRTPLLAAIDRAVRTGGLSTEPAEPELRQVLQSTRDVLDTLDRQPLPRDCHTAIRLQVRAIERVLARQS